MRNFIKFIDINNFKSIKHCKINDCERINLFIGRPNVGKSNILEALSLFTLPYLRENNSKKLSNLIRIEHESEIFHNGETAKECVINTSIGKCELTYHLKEGLQINVDFFSDSYLLKVNANLNVKNNSRNDFFEPPVKRFVYKSDVKYKKSHAKYLIPPFGSNLLPIIENYQDLKEQVTGFFKDYNLEIAFDKASQTIKIIQYKDGEIFLIPYNSIADTLQRIIFYKAAIASNNDSILLFEEPEAHSFPPYMTHLTQEMIYKKDNQFFVATHSPFILNDLLENAMDELAVFIVDYQDNATIVKQMSKSALHEVLQNGIDLFTNNESFI